MKKKLVASLAAAMVLGVAGTSFAAANPFVDVPAKHWSYAAVTELAKDGIVDGYGNGQFQGDKTITRYEMAQIVAKAMAKEDKATAAQKATIDKLSAEFATELEGLNVRLTKVEAKQDNVKWGGEIRERFDSVKLDNVDRDTTNSHSYVDMWATTQINADWVGKVEYESNKRMTNGVTSNGVVKAGQDENEPNTTRIYAQGALAGGKATVGKFNPFSAYGLIIDDNMTGIQYEFGNVVKSRIGYGKYAGSLPTATLAAAPTYGFAEFDYGVSKDTNVKLAYHNLSKLNAADAAALGNSSVHYIEGGFDTKLATDWVWMGTYARSNVRLANPDNKSYLTQVTYKVADTKAVGSYDIFADYRKIPAAGTMDATWDYANGYKGVRVGFDYIPATNIKLNAFYFAAKKLDTATTTATNDNIYRAQAEFFF